VLAATGGRGVDVVLNALAGDGMAASLRALAPDGRFLELGKRDIYADRPLPLGVFKKRIRYAAIDLAGIARDRPARFAALLADVAADLAAGKIAPPPLERYPIGRAEDAFRRMAAGAHHGKVVLDLTGPEPAIASEERARLRPDAAYLVTGGLGGLGLALARALTMAGGRELILIGRSGAAGREAAVEALSRAGARVRVVAADVSDRAALAAALERARAEGPPLRGVFHLAGVLDDGLLRDQTPARIARVLAPKASGAWNLHELTRDDPLDFFVLYSSAAALLGPPAQGAYAAANAFLGALAHARRTEGRPALAVAWGPFADVGMAAADARRSARLGGRGLRVMSPDEGPPALFRLIETGLAEAAFISLDARTWVEVHPELAASPLFSRLLAETEPAPAAGARRDAIAAARPTERPLLIEQLVRAELAAVLRLDLDRIAGDAPFESLGVDSLLGLEVRNRLRGALGIPIPATLLWTFPTPRELAAHLAARLFPPLAAAPEPPAAPAGDPARELEDRLAAIERRLA
jgi:NAD(P)-dependent dehydrogenase (short-subunit alcohol dehydrogenase family)/acyl carrier protein